MKVVGKSKNIETVLRGARMHASYGMQMGKRDPDLRRGRLWQIFSLMTASEQKIATSCVQALSSWKGAHTLLARKVKSVYDLE